MKSIINQIIEREAGWVDYYTAQIGLNPIDEKRIQEREADARLDDQLAKHEIKFITKLWHGDQNGAADELVGVIEKVRTENPRLAGWYALCIGQAYCNCGDFENMHGWFDEARNRLGGGLPLPRQDSGESEVPKPPRSIVEEGLRAICTGKIPQINRRLNNIEDRSKGAFQDCSHKVAEEAVRHIGSVLGFDSRRPCTDVHDGPDNIWIDHHKKLVIPFELKTDKKNNNLNQEEVGQAFQHLQWTRENYSDYDVPGILMYTESAGISNEANPSAEMFFCNREKMQLLWAEFIGEARSMAKKTPLEMHGAASALGEEERWTVRGIFERLIYKPLKPT
ncbi:hypothetical protein [Jiella marina]|uniref:hypothetical protein n=1 Tax=Jiella sp. LLJ827 TaxID=2917712 RepID=UPI0021013C64|nr:hypothetical protein [Jiella sp. LLJ827]MCQ0989151.1 hypothetical protein [Jiella sp. LLJ827]